MFSFGLPDCVIEAMLGELERVLDDAVPSWRDASGNARQFNALPDTHDEWRSLNESEDGKPL